MLAWTIYISFLGALALCLLGPGQAGIARALALVIALLGLGVVLVVAIRFEPGPELVPLIQLEWIADLGIQFYLAADGISLTLVLLTGIAAVVGVLFSWNVEDRVREFFALYFTLIGGVYGVFLSFDLFLFFVFYEIAIIPKYFLIAIWGSTRREYGAMKLALYSFVGSALIMAGIIAAYVVAGANTFSLPALAQVQFPEEFQRWAFPVVFVGFGILAGLWPLHTWAPTGHVAAPTAASMLLAGVVMKLGAYGALRVAMTLFPEGAEFWKHVLALLAAVGIVYGALVALVQKDFKFVIGYSSVSHMGFVLLGMMTMTTIGLSGAVLQMFSHGIIAGLLFAVVGRMVYDRTHTRQLEELRGLRLDRALPFAGVTFLLGALASMGMPGFSGFVAELQVLIGAWRAFPVLALVAGAGVVLGVAYMIRTLQQSFYSGEAEMPAAVPQHAGIPNGSGLGQVTTPERVGAVVLISCSLVVGLYPGLLLNWILPALQSPLMAPLVQGGEP